MNLPALRNPDAPLAAILSHPAVRRVHIGGGCVSSGRRFRAKAHAHTSPTDEHFGTICFLSTKWVGHDALTIHEVCHLLAGRGHDDAWRAKVVEMGGTLDPIPGVLRSYHKRGCAARCPALEQPCDCVTTRSPA